jgi:hypothetical protein
VQLAVTRGVHRFVERCSPGKRLLAATHAVGFYGASPPSAALVASVAVAQTVRAGAVHLVVRAGPLPGARVVVQVEMECA